MSSDTKAYRFWEEAKPAAAPPHEEEERAAKFDNDAYAVFHSAVVEKMQRSRDGWESMPTEALADMLHGHVQKGDPLDIAIIAMMLWHLGCRGNGSIPRPKYSAPLPKEVAKALHALEFDGNGELDEDHKEVLLSHLAALTSRVAELEGELHARTRLAPNAQDALKHAREEILSRFNHMEFSARQSTAHIGVYDLEALCGGLEQQTARAERAEARVAELEETLKREREDHHDIPTIAYMQGASAGRDAANLAISARDAAEDRAEAAEAKCAVLEDERARVMEWAKERGCSTCAYLEVLATYEPCESCSSDCGNWTPAWEVKP